MTTLTQCQQQVLDMLISYQQERGFPPTNQEVATMLGYAMWISPAFSLKVIRTFDALHNSSPEETTSDKIKSGVILLESAAKTLNLSNSSKLGAYQKLSKVAGLPELMPIYAIDAPADAPDGSSRPTLSLSALLKQYGIRLTANQAYHQMVKLGIVEQRERYSRTAINNIKKFWSLTAKGCMFGKNITSPANPRETQPHFFESRFTTRQKVVSFWLGVTFTECRHPHRCSTTV